SAAAASRTSSSSPRPAARTSPSSRTSSLSSFQVARDTESEERYQAAGGRRPSSRGVDMETRGIQTRAPVETPTGRPVPDTVDLELDERGGAPQRRGRRRHAD